jgi:hypothetical protein
MSNKQYIYRFAQDIPLDEVGTSLSVAALTTESLHGRCALRLEGQFRLDRETRHCVVNASTQVGRDFARVFTGLISVQFGEKDFHVRFVDLPEPTPVEGGVQ